MTILMWYNNPVVVSLLSEYSVMSSTSVLLVTFFQNLTDQEKQGHKEFLLHGVMG
jgi:hypothetical protein